MKPLNCYTCKLTPEQGASLKTFLEQAGFAFREVPYAAFAGDKGKVGVVFYHSGKLVVRSKQLGMAKVGTLRWDGAAAQSRMDNLLSAFYGKDKVHAVLSPYDGLSIGILSSLKGVGYCTAEQPCPVVSGQDAEVPSVKSILKGEQYSTVFKDTRDLAKVTANLVDAVLAGKQPEINDTKTYNNGIKVVPSYLLKPVAVDKSNWKKILVDSGYYKESQIQ